MIPGVTSEPVYDFDINPNKMTAETEANMKINMEHVSLYFVFYILIVNVIIWTEFMPEHLIMGRKYQII